MAGADEILTTIRKIHEAPLSHDGWTRALSSIAATVASEGACFLVQCARTGGAKFVTGSALPPQHVEAFGAEVCAGRPAWARTLPAGSVTPSSAMMADREFARSVFYNEAIRPIGHFYGLAVVPLRSRSSNVYLSTGRRLGREDYDSRDIAVMQALLPHLTTALHVGERLQRADLEGAGARQAIDRLGTGLILADATARIVFANALAESLLARNDGLRVDREGLRSADHRITRALRRLIARCGQHADGAGGTLLLPRGAGRAPLRVVVAPFRAEAAELDTAWLAVARPVAILMITDPEHRQQGRSESLRRRFGLTPAEADVASEILKGDGREAAAARLGVAVTTVRAHLTHIFEKTGVRRQAELVRLLLESDGLVGD